MDKRITNFKNFLYLCWKHLNLPDPTEIQYDIADFLQDGPKRLQIQGFRGVGKSWITAAFVLWTLFNDNEKKIMIISASKERADRPETARRLRLRLEVSPLRVCQLPARLLLVIICRAPRCVCGGF